MWSSYSWEFGGLVPSALPHIFFHIPKWVLDTLDRIQKPSFEKGPKKRGWAMSCELEENVCLQGQGVLGVINLHHFDIALLVKWWQRFFDNPYASLVGSVLNE